MARNEEKAQSMLNRYLKQKADESGENLKEKRPYLALLCDDLDAAEKWRRQILKEISRKVSEIQNPGLQEPQIRDLNDEINKLIREKYHWERRIKDLNGPDYAKTAPPITDGNGEDVLVIAPSGKKNKGARYYYFGAARKLPGVKELIAKAIAEEEEDKKMFTINEMYKNVDAEYYGYLGSDDEDIERFEDIIEEKARQEMREKWMKDHDDKAEMQVDGDIDNNQYDVISGGAGFITFVPLPSQDEMERVILERKKEELLEKYGKD